MNTLACEQALPLKGLVTSQEKTCAHGVRKFGLPAMMVSSARPLSEKFRILRIGVEPVMSVEIG